MLDELKKDFPGISEEVLKQVADEEGLNTSPATTEQEEVEEVQSDESTDSTYDESENNEEQEQSEPAEQDKKVSLKALHEERNKRKALSAQLEAMKSEIEAIKNRPQQTQEQKPQQSMNEYIEQQADIDARKAINIPANEDIESLQWSDPSKYRKYIKELAKSEMRIESDIKHQQEIASEVNKNLQYFNSQPDFKEVDIYAGQTIEDLPMKQARPIQMAVEALQRGNINQEQITLLKTFYEKCQTEYRSTKGTNKAQPTNKLAEMANHPRASQLQGNGGSRSLSTSEIENMLDQGRYEDIPPDIRKKFMR